MTTVATVLLSRLAGLCFDFQAVPTSTKKGMDSVCWPLWTGEFEAGGEGHIFSTDEDVGVATQNGYSLSFQTSLGLLPLFYRALNIKHDVMGIPNTLIFIRNYAES